MMVGIKNFKILRYCVNGIGSPNKTNALKLRNYNIRDLKISLYSVSKYFNRQI